MDPCITFRSSEDLNKHSLLKIKTISQKQNLYPICKRLSGISVRQKFHYSHVISLFLFEPVLGKIAPNDMKKCWQLKIHQSDMSIVNDKTNHLPCHLL